MIAINLIRQRYIIPVARKERLLLLIGVFLPILLFSFIVLGVVHSVNETVIQNYSSRIDKQEAAAKEIQKKALSPTNEENAWQAQLKKVNAFQEQRFLLTPKLVVLADATPNRFYFTKIIFEENSVLLEGQGLPGNQTTASLALFLEQLNGNENFIQGLSELRIEEIKEEDGISKFTISSPKK
jgi:hypothetical protein